MAAPGGDVFEEHLGVIAALRENYMRREDAVTVANINSLREQVAQLCKAREDEVKEAIRDLTQRVEAAEIEATYPESEDAHQLRVEEIERATSAAREGVEQLSAHLQELETQRAAVRAELQHLAEKEKELERLIDHVEPHIRHKLSLYAHVSKIVWDFENCDRVAGVIDDPSHGNLGKFDLGDQVTFDAVNKMWGLIDGEEAL